MQAAGRLSLVLADSEVAFVAAAQGGVRIRLSAAHVLRSEALGQRPTPGFSRGVVLWLAGAEPPADGGDFMGRIAQGRARIEGRWAAQLALPSSWAGPVRLELAFANGSQLVLDAEALSCCHEGEPNFSESLFC